MNDFEFSRYLSIIAGAQTCLKNGDRQGARTYYENAIRYVIDSETLPSTLMEDPVVNLMEMEQMPY